MKRWGEKREKRLKKMGGILLLTFFWILLSGFASGEEVVIKGKVTEYAHPEKGIEKVLIEAFPQKLDRFEYFKKQTGSRYFTYTDEGGNYRLSVPVCDGEKEVCLPEISNDLEVRASKEGYRAQSAWLEDVKPEGEIEVNFVLERIPLPTPTPESTPEPTPTPRPDNQPPVAVIKANPTSGKAPLKVDFSGENSYDPDGEIKECLWNFGDGSFSNASCAIQHTYGKEGNYHVQLQVKDNDGATATANTVIKVISLVQPPYIEYSAIVKGKITDAETGEPIVDAIVSTFLFDRFLLEPDDYQDLGFSRNSTRTDAQGNYELKLTWKGESKKTFQISVQKIGQGKCYKETKEIEVENEGTYTLDFSLKKQDKCFNFNRKVYIREEIN
ncbi:MAG: PKD domain-containing protein [Candidatus Omnitrophica bacterium]|nr:PKD domain-containing protein [Candidatus Omnitrophota bacterium]